MSDGALFELRALAELVRTREALVALERRLVCDARDRGARWRQIGEALGVSAQAVHRRYVGIDPVARRLAADPFVREQHDYEAFYAALAARARVNRP